MLSVAHTTFGVLGIPLDQLEMDEVIAEIDQAAGDRRALLISTVNTNFLVNSLTNPGFKQSLLASQLCTVDGIGMLLMCKLLSAGSLVRVSGSDMLDQLLHRQTTALGRPLRVFFFGGDGTVSDVARHRVNTMPSSAVCCVGALNPGFGTMDELSRPAIIQIINDANPDFLVVALGAQRGQEWLLRNRPALRVAVCAHLGAAVNFVAGSVQRAPPRWQALGLEWLWRIRQEPYLAARYAHDGLALLSLVLGEALPQAAGQAWDRLRLRFRPRALRVAATVQDEEMIVQMDGAALGASQATLQQAFARALEDRRGVTLECAGLWAVDSAASGQILRLQRDLAAGGRALKIRHVSARLRRHLGLSNEAAA